MEMFGILYIIQTIVTLFVWVSWSLYLGYNLKLSQRFHRGATKCPDSTGLNDQIAYHYKTEIVKYKLLLCIMFAECLASGFGALIYLTRTNSSIQNANFERQLNQCLSSEIDLEDQNSLGIFILTDFNHITAIVETIGNIFWLVSLGLTTSLIRIILHRKNKQSEFPRDAYLPLKFSLLSSALLVMTILTKYTALLRNVLTPILLSIFYIINIKSFKLLYQRLKQNALDIQIDYGRNTTYFKHVRMVKRFKIIAIITNLINFVLISASTLINIEKLASVFLYTGGCYFKLLYNINYIPFLQTEFQIRVLVKVNEVVKDIEIFGLVLPAVITADLICLLVILKLAYSFFHHKITGKMKVPIHYTGHITSRK